jgi:hypothetical protein
MVEGVVTCDIVTSDHNLQASAVGPELELKK